MLHHDQQPSPSSSFSPLINRDSVITPSGSSSPSSSASSSSRVNEEVDEQGHVSEQEEHEQQRPEMEQQNNGGIYIRGVVFGFVEGTLMRDDTCSCVIVTFMFWIFVSMTMILGVFGPVNFSLGPNCSYLIHPNALFLQSVKVEELDDNSHGLTLYGFYESPPLDVVKTWTETQNYTVPSESHLESVYFLNNGSQINISYHVNPPGSFVYLVISQGSDSFFQWINDPSYPNYTLSWNIIEGNGIVQQNISDSSSYYVAVGNTNSGEVEVQLNLSVKSSMYNTTEAYYKCTFIHGVCTLRIFPTGNSLLLTSPDATMGLHNDWNVKLSYGPRWATYIIGIVVMNVVMLAATNLLKKLRCIHHEETAARFHRVEDQAAPLLSHKDDDDLSSWGSCYDSGSNDEKAFEELLAAGCTEGKLLSLEDGENGNNTRRLCAICFDGPRDCFFLPCGHCVACFACGDRIAEAAGTCPICRRNIKKVRKIFMV